MDDHRSIKSGSRRQSIKLEAQKPLILMPKLDIRRRSTEASGVNAHAQAEVFGLFLDFYVLSAARVDTYLTTTPVPPAPPHTHLPSLTAVQAV